MFEYYIDMISIINMIIYIFYICMRELKTLKLISEAYSNQLYNLLCRVSKQNIKTILLISPIYIRQVPIMVDLYLYYIRNSYCNIGISVVK